MLERKENQQIGGKGWEDMSSPKECRLCMTKEPDTLKFRRIKPFRELIETCCGLKAFEKDGLPDYLCVACCDSLKSFSEFRSRCIESYKFYRSLPTEPEPTRIKREPEPTTTPSLREIKLEPQVEGHEETVWANNLEKAKKGERRRKKGAQPKSKCQQCGERYVNLRRHALAAHADSDPRPHACDKCGKRFKSKGKLNCHRVRHENLNLQCPKCGGVYATREGLSRHDKRVHLRAFRYECAECPRVFHCPSAFKYHKSAHAGAEGRKFECDACGRRSPTKSLLILHLKTHADERPFVCSHCAKRFRDRNYLILHERLHTGEAPFACPLCEKRYAQLCNLKSHFRHNHKGSDFAREYKGRRVPPTLLPRD